jgi:hypothetical protein
VPDAHAVLVAWLAWLDLDWPWSDPSKSGGEWDAFIEQKIRLREHAEYLTRNYFAEVKRAQEG